jgi:hypothetical protein
MATNMGGDGGMTSQPRQPREEETARLRQPREEGTPRRNEPVETVDLDENENRPDSETMGREAENDFNEEFRP